MNASTGKSTGDTTAANTLPPVIAAYLAASDRGDTAAIVACFAPDALVVDEQRQWRGTEAIRQWRESVASAYEYTVQVTGAQVLGEADVTADGLERYEVFTHLKGNFPGGEVDLTDQFALRAGRIARLEIVPTEAAS